MSFLILKLITNLKSISRYKHRDLDQKKVPDSFLIKRIRHSAIFVKSQPQAFNIWLPASLRSNFYPPST